MIILIPEHLICDQMYKSLKRKQSQSSRRAPAKASQTMQSLKPLIFFARFQCYCCQKCPALKYIVHCLPIFVFMYVCMYVCLPKLCFLHFYGIQFCHTCASLTQVFVFCHSIVFVVVVFLSNDCLLALVSLLLCSTSLLLFLFDCIICSLLLLLLHELLLCTQFS